jgi:putative ABC transport system permease protein
MQALRKMLSPLSGLLRQGDIERELSAELESHLDMHVADNVRAGMTPEEARRQALIALGGVQQTKESHREARGVRWVDELRLDLRYAMRSLVKNPGFTATAVITLAMGVGANAAVFAVTYGILMRPLPYRDPSRLVVLNLLFRDGGDLGFHPPTVAHRLERLEAVGDAAAYNVRDITVRAGGESAVVSTVFVTDRFFRALGVSALSGETIDFGARGGLVVSNRLVDRLLHVPASQALGRSVNVGENTYLVAAVISPVSGFPAEGNDAWVLTAPTPKTKPQDTGNFRILLRLKPGITVERARQEFKGDRDLSITPVGEAGRSEMAPVLRVSVAAGLLVLFVACANVATLFIGRNITRRREIAARLALGASPPRLARVFFIETLLLAAVASVAGVALAAGLLHLFVQHAAGVVPRVLAVTLDGPVLVAIVILTGAVAILCGAFPAWHAARADFHPFLRTTVVSTPAAWKLRGALVVSQIAFSIVLLIGAGLLTRSVIQLLNEDHGFTAAGVVEAKIVLSDRLLGGEDRAGFVRELLARVRALPGVTFAGLGNALPPSPRLITVAGQIIEKSEGIDETRFFKIGSVTPDFLRALGAQFLSGRDFSDADGDVVVVSESAAKFFFRNRDPIGGYVPTPRGIIQFAGKPTVIGVVRDIKYEGLDSPPGSTVYVPWDRRPMGTTYLVVRSSGDLVPLSSMIRLIAREVHPAIPVPEVQPLENVLASSIANRRLGMFPAIGFAALALSVALVGLLATLSRAVTERRQELAIRAAVGASPSQLVWMILAKGLLLTCLGVIAGLGAARAIGQNLAHLLFRVSPYDPPTFGGVAVLVSAGSIVAVYIAARRAASADPLAALRYE